MTRLSPYSFDKTPFAQPLFDGFDQLCTERKKVDAVIVDWAQSIEDADLVENFQFASVIDGKTRSAPKWVFVTQMFNHQTHHRGQISTLLHQRGSDFDNTDIPRMPGTVDYL
jgi:uncharacterized damage-inducible protein DinB